MCLSISSIIGRANASPTNCIMVTRSRAAVDHTSAGSRACVLVRTTQVCPESPYVGICFGHQLLAQALGGKVERSPYGWGVGVRDFNVVSAKPWMEGAPSNIALIGSHQDQVTELPTSAELLFTSDYCPNGGFAIGERAWTLQVPPEFTPELADHLLAGRVELIGAERVAEARASLTRSLDRHLVAGWIQTFFASC